MMAGDEGRNSSFSRRRQREQAENRIEKKLRTKKKRQKKQWKISRGGCIGRVVLLLLIVLGCYLFMQTSVFQLQEIEVRGLQTIKEDEIITLSGISLGENIFQVDRSKAEEQILLHALVADVQIKTRPPKKILIEINERVGVGSILFEGNYFSVDEEGVVLLASTQIDEDLPLFTGLDLPDTVSMGMKLEGDAVADVILIATKVKDRYSGMQKEIKVAGENNYSLYLDRMEVKLGDAHDLTAKLTVLDDLLATLPAKSKENVEYIDVSAPKKPAVKEKSQ